MAEAGLALSGVCLDEPTVMEAVGIEVFDVSASLGKMLDAQRWDDYVHRHRYGSSFHLTAWKKSMEETFRYKPIYLAAFEDGAIRGVLPMFLVQNLIVGKALISCPFSVYGGILADSVAIRNLLGAYAEGIGRELDVDFIEFRNGWHEQCYREPNVSRYFTFTQAPIADEAELLRVIPKKTRNLIRKALRHQYSTRFTRDIGSFYNLYSRNMRRLGTPCFPRRHFQTLLHNFASEIDLREVVLDGKVVAASMNFHFRDRMHTYYAASDQNYNAFSPNNYMYFEYLRWAGQNGYGTFDFGRCKLNTGTFDFKRHWATVMRPLPYEILLLKRKELPNFSPTNNKFSLPIRIWQSMPLSLTREIGPHVVRLFP